MCHANWLGVNNNNRLQARQLVCRLKIHVLHTFSMGEKKVCDFSLSSTRGTTRLVRGNAHLFQWLWQSLKSDYFPCAYTFYTNDTVRLLSSHKAENTTAHRTILCHVPSCALVFILSHCMHVHWYPTVKSVWIRHTTGHQQNISKFLWISKGLVILYNSYQC